MVNMINTIELRTIFPSFCGLTNCSPWLFLHSIDRVVRRIGRSVQVSEECYNWSSYQCYSRMMGLMMFTSQNLSVIINGLMNMLIDPECLTEFSARGRQVRKVPSMTNGFALVIYRSSWWIFHENSVWSIEWDDEFLQCPSHFMLVFFFYLFNIQSLFYMDVSENSVALNPLVFMIIIPFLNG